MNDDLPAVGDFAERATVITPELVAAFGAVSGDHNPLHFDDEFARQTPFGQRIAHGMLAAALISAVLGNDLPGPGAIYLGQTLRFVAPVHLGDTLTVRLEVTAARTEKRLLTLATTVTNQDGAAVVTGEATVKVMARAG